MVTPLPATWCSTWWTTPRPGTPAAGACASATRARPRSSRTDDEPDLRLRAEALGAAYLGGVSPALLAASGLVEELRPAAATRLWHSLRTDTRPAASIGF